jgi:RNA polymerase sigma factor (sigma-70 family)
MVRPKKSLAETDKKQYIEETEDRTEEILLYVKLVDCVRRSRNKVKADGAFNTIITMLDVKIQQIAYKFHIPGLSFNDVYQEALFALRFKAIKDYNKDRSDIREVSPFDKFAALCIRRHLSTKLKAAYQNKSRVLNLSISLDQDRNKTGSDENLFLSDILPVDPDDIASKLDKFEYHRKLLVSLFQKLSSFEKEVFVLYCRKYSYEEIAYHINKTYHKSVETISVKSVDNGLSRIKQKAKSVLKKIEDTK